MDIDKAGRTRSYVHTQLAFVPLYGTDLVGPGESLPEVFGLQTPILAARNPLVVIQPESNPPESAAVYPEGMKGDPTQVGSPTKNPSKSQKKPLAKHHLGVKERKRPLNPKSDTRTTPGLNSLREPVEERTPLKRERGSRREKARLPASLSFLYGFAPKNVGPSRLTVQTGDKGVFGKGKSSSTVVGISLPDLAARPMFREEPELTTIGSQLPSTLPSRGLDRGDFICFGNQQHIPKSTEKIAECITPQSGRAGGMLHDRSTTRAIELEDGILPGDPSSFACDTTVVIDTGKIWDQEGAQHFLESGVSYCDELRPLAARNPKEHPPSRPASRVASRFFPERMPGFGLRKDRPTPRTSPLDWGDPNPNREPEVPTLDDYLDYSCPGIAWDGSSNQGTSSSFGDHCGTPLAVHREMITGWSDPQDLNVSSPESEGNNLLVGEPLLGDCYDVLLDWDPTEKVHCFSEGKRLLFGM